MLHDCDRSRRDTGLLEHLAGDLIHAALECGFNSVNRLGAESVGAAIAKRATQKIEVAMRDR
jgi:hypothetical protein